MLSQKLFKSQQKKLQEKLQTYWKKQLQRKKRISIQKYNLSCLANVPKLHIPINSHTIPSILSDSIPLDPISYVKTSQIVYSGTEPIFKNNDGQIYIKSKPYTTLEEANKKALLNIKQFGLNEHILHGALLFHGTTSAFLITFFKEHIGLFPHKLLKEYGQTFFSGETSFEKIDHINYEHISTVWLGYFENMLTYSLLQKFKFNEDFNDIHKMLKKGEEDPNYRFFINYSQNALETLSKRYEYFNKLSPLEKDLINNTFPVIVGILPKKQPEDIIRVKSDISGEIAIKNGANIDEIVFLMVPPRQVDFVKDIVNGLTNVEPFTPEIISYLHGQNRYYFGSY